MLSRAYAFLNVKAVDGERRIITGTATTPTPDRMGDIIEPLGIKFKNPLPLLLYHDAKKPVGTVKFSKPTEDGVGFEARLPMVEEAGTVRDRIEEAWTSIKTGLLAGVSIGFRPIEVAFNKETDGMRFLESEVLELSLVAIPAQPDARIETIKSLDIGLAVSGIEPAVESPNTSGVSDRRRPVKLMARPGSPMKKTYSEQIKEWEATRQAKTARMDEILEPVDGTVPTKELQDEHDQLALDVKEIDAHLVRLREAEKRNVAAAVPAAGTTPREAAATRTGVVTMKTTVPKGTAFTRYCMAIAASRGSRLEAAEYAKRWEASTPEVALVLKHAISASTPNLAEILTRAAVTAGSTTDSDWAAPLVVYQNLANEFIELLRAETILDKITGLRRVPFNISIPRQTQAGTVGWVGQSKPKPVGELKFDQVTLGMAKAAGIIVLNEELVRSSDPSAEALVRADLIATMAEYLDTQLLDPSVAEVSNVSPASITFGVTPVDSSGTNYAALVVDVKAIFANFTAANIKRAGMVAIMSETQAQSLAMMLNALGLRSLPDVNMMGGNIFGIPVITSENVPLDGGSPDGGRIIFVSAPNVLLADDGGVAIDVSREASVQMNSTPDDPASASTVMISLWQNNLVGLRAERFINWKKRRDAAVQYINDANYA